jgi:hypothetical protein
LQRVGLNLGVEPLDLVDDAGLGVAVNERATLDQDAFQLDRHLAVIRGRDGSNGRRVRFARGASGRREIEARPAIGENLELDRRLDQDDALHLDLEAEQGEKREAQAQRLEHEEIRARRTLDIGEADVVRLERQRRQDREVEIAGYDQLAAGPEFRLLGDLTFVLVPIDQARQYQYQRDQRHDERADNDEGLLQVSISLGGEIRGRDPNARISAGNGEGKLKHTRAAAAVFAVTPRRVVRAPVRLHAPEPAARDGSGPPLNQWLMP